MSNPYSVLGLRPGASLDEARTAFRALARTYHPDMSRGDQQAGRRMAEINAAYDTLQRTIGAGPRPIDPGLNKPSFLRLMTDAERAALDQCAADHRRAARPPKEGRLRAPWRKGRRVEGPPILPLSGVRVEDDLMRLSFDGAPRPPETMLVLPMLHWTNDFQMRVAVDPPRMVPIAVEERVHKLDITDPGAFVSGWTGKLRLLFGT